MNVSLTRERKGLRPDKKARVLGGEKCHIASEETERKKRPPRRLELDRKGA